MHVFPLDRLHLRKLTHSALCLAFCMILPFVTGQIPQVGSALCPMHLPVLLAGFLCGPGWGAAVGAVAPLLRYILFGMPPIFPTGVAMCFELAAYGLVSGLLYARSPKTVGATLLSLIAAMLAGRVVWGVVMVIILGLSGAPFTWSAFLAGAFINALPGIILQIILVPTIVLALTRAERSNS